MLCGSNMGVRYGCSDHYIYNHSKYGGLYCEIWGNRHKVPRGVDDDICAVLSEMSCREEDEFFALHEAEFIVKFRRAKEQVQADAEYQMTRELFLQHRKGLRNRFRSGEITNVQYQQSLTPLQKLHKKWLHREGEVEHRFRNAIGGKWLSCRHITKLWKINGRLS